MYYKFRWVSVFAIAAGPTDRQHILVAIRLLLLVHVRYEFYTEALGSILSQPLSSRTLGTSRSQDQRVVRKSLQMRLFELPDYSRAMPTTRWL